MHFLRPGWRLLVLVAVLVVVAAGCAGTQTWASLYNGPLNWTDAPSSIGVDAGAKTVVVTGSSYGIGTGKDYATVAYDVVTGDQRWVARYNGPAGAADQATSLALSPDGNTAFVTGSSESAPNGPVYYATIAYDVADGHELWVARDNRPGGGAKSVVVSPDGTRVFVTGVVDSGANAADYGTIAYSAANGTELWFANYDDPVHYLDFANKIAISPDGTSVFVTGESALEDFATVAYNAANGAQRWVGRYNGPADSFDNPTDLAVRPDGTLVFVTGRSQGLISKSDYATVAYNPVTGAQRWVARYNGPANSNDGASALGLSPDGLHVFVTGYSFNDANGNSVAAATVAYGAATGRQQWATRYDGPLGYTTATGLAVNPDGTKVYIVGTTDTGSPRFEDYATVAYNTANGTQQWATLYNGPTNTNDFGTAIAASPDGKKVFATGFTNEYVDEGYPPPHSPPTGPSQDYATVGYNTS